MTVTSKPIEVDAEEAQNSPWRPLLILFWLAVAGSIWLIGLNATYLVVAVVALPVPITVLLAVAFQAALSYVQSPIWNWNERRMTDEDGLVFNYERPRWIFFGPTTETPALRPVSKMEWAALLIDAGINIGGAWLLVKHAHELPPVVAVAEMFGTRPVPTEGWTALGWCAIIGIIVAGVPELIRSRVLKE